MRSTLGEHSKKMWLEEGEIKNKNLRRVEPVMTCLWVEYMPFVDGFRD
jgi:hypothetical protein